jgi:glucosamine-phosphate N-acetyltransferase
MKLPDKDRLQKELEEPEQQEAAFTVLDPVHQVAVALHDVTHKANHDALSREESPAKLAGNKLPVKVRELTGKDVREADKNCLFETIEALAPTGLTIDEAVKTYLAMIRRGINVFALEYFGKIIGVASLIIEPKLIHGGRPVGHIEDVAIHKDFQKQGLGRILIEHLKQRAINTGCRKLILDCNNDVAVFYEKCGFKHWCVAMRRDLP